MVGLLHPRICEDLDLFSRGLHLTYPDPQLYVPIEPGIGIVDHLDEDRTWAEMRRWAAASDVKGFGALVKYLKGIRSKLRPKSDDDLWLHEAPTREDDRRPGGERSKGDAHPLRAVLRGPW